MQLRDEKLRRAEQAEQDAIRQAQIWQDEEKIMSQAAD